MAQNYEDEVFMGKSRFKPKNVNNFPHKKKTKNIKFSHFNFSNGSCKAGVFAKL